MIVFLCESKICKCENFHPQKNDSLFCIQKEAMATPLRSNGLCSSMIATGLDVYSIVAFKFSDCKDSRARKYAYKASRYTHSREPPNYFFFLETFLYDF